ALRRARAPVPAVPPRALRRVQPGLRPRHPLRPAEWRPCRIDPDEPAAAGALGIRLRAGRRQQRAAPAGLPAPARLADRTALIDAARRSHEATRIDQTSVSAMRPQVGPTWPTRNRQESRRGRGPGLRLCSATGTPLIRRSAPLPPQGGRGPPNGRRAARQESPCLSPCEPAVI